MRALSVDELEKWLDRNGWELKSITRPSVFAKGQFKIVVMHDMVKVRERRDADLIMVSSAKAAKLDGHTMEVHVGQFNLGALK